MTPDERLVASVQRHEGFRATVYDDATGEPIVPGSIVIGHPTIGYGWALDVTPMSRAQAFKHLTETLDERKFDVLMKLPWLAELDDVRRNVVVELAYNLGLGGLLAFTRMLDALKRRRWVLAGEELLDSKWAREDVSTERSTRLHRMLVSGEWPTA